MLTRVRAWLGRLRAWWFRLCLAWELARSPHVPTLLALVPRLDGPTYEGAVWAVRKVGLDRSLKAAQNEQLRAEAVQWARHWYRDRGLAPHAWDVRVCVEVAVGRLKGYLP